MQNNPEKIVKLAIAHLLSSELKAEDAPASAEAHFETALLLMLRAIDPSLASLSEEEKKVVEGMLYGDKPWSAIDLIIEGASKMDKAFDLRGLRPGDVVEIVFEDEELEPGQSLVTEVRSLYFDRRGRIKAYIDLVGGSIYCNDESMLVFTDDTAIIQSREDKEASLLATFIDDTTGEVLSSFEYDISWRKL